jgi:L-threonylcarbamoyladenylate synthase
MDHSEALNQPSCGPQCTGARLLAAKVRKVDPWFPEADVIAWAASCITRGGVVIYPTETFYGLGGDPLQTAIVERVFGIKERNRHKPLPLIAADEGAVRRAVAHWPPEADRLARALWPGPLTLVLTASTLLPPALHAHSGKIAVRVSSHAVARELAVAVGGLIISSSANLSGQVPCRDPERLPGELLRHVDAVLDGGLTAGGKPSTLVDVTVQPPTLVRAGAIGWDCIEALLT